MKEKFENLKITKIVSKVALLIMIIILIKTLMDNFSDYPSNVIGALIIFVIFITPFSLLTVYINKYYVFIGEDYIEVNGLRKKTIIKFEDIFQITGHDGLNIRYTYGEKKRKSSIIISSTIKGFKRIRKYVIYSYFFNNKTFSGLDLNNIDRKFYKDIDNLSIKTLKDTDFKKYSKASPYKSKEIKDYSLVNNEGKFISTLIKGANGDITEIRFEEIEKNQE